MCCFLCQHSAPCTASLETVPAIYVLSESYHGAVFQVSQGSFLLFFHLIRYVLHWCSRPLMPMLPIIRRVLALLNLYIGLSSSTKTNGWHIQDNAYMPATQSSDKVAYLDIFFWLCGPKYYCPAVQHLKTVRSVICRVWYVMVSSCLERASLCSPPDCTWVAAVGNP